MKVGCRRCVLNLIPMRRGSTVPSAAPKQSCVGAPLAPRHIEPHLPTAGLRLSMPKQTFSPGPRPGTVRDAEGTVHAVPNGWALLPPGDAGLTRRVKAAGEHWMVQEKKGRRTFSKGIWAPQETIRRAGEQLQAERSTDAYQKRKASDARRRQVKQSEYVDDFYSAVLEYLDFHPGHAELGKRLAQAITEHATPVGSGTVARTKRIPVERRAEAAVIAWMRHQTTAYDSMKIPRVKGKRREIRRMLARRSKELLARYRGEQSIATRCPLREALQVPTRDVG